jgi:hypothetical protein
MRIHSFFVNGHSEFIREAGVSDLYIRKKSVIIEGRLEEKAVAVQPEWSES